MVAAVALATTPADAIPNNLMQAFLSRAWELLDQPDTPCSVDTSSPRTYVSDDADDLSTMMQRSFPSTPSKTPAEHPTTPMDAIPSNLKQAVLSRAWELLDQPDSPCSVDTSTPRTYVSDDADDLSAMIQLSLQPLSQWPEVPT